MLFWLRLSEAKPRQVNLRNLWFSSLLTNSYRKPNVADIEIKEPRSLVRQPSTQHDVPFTEPPGKTSLLISSRLCTDDSPRSSCTSRPPLSITDLLAPKSRKSHRFKSLTLKGTPEKALKTLPNKVFGHFDPACCADLACSDFSASLPIAQHISR